MSNKITDLKDTVDLMLSTDRVERFKAEYYQLAIRLRKLTEFLLAWDLDELPEEPKAKRYDLEEQQRIMRMYVENLQKRAKNEGIDL